MPVAFGFYYLGERILLKTSMREFAIKWFTKAVVVGYNQNNKDVRANRSVTTWLAHVNAKTVSVKMTGRLVCALNN